jgi:hypothetical protein
MHTQPITNHHDEEALGPTGFPGPDVGQRRGGSLLADDDGRTGVMVGDVARQLAVGMKSIPTTYHGVRFRSRLEAKWAAFFDLAAWRWEYEPFDMDGWAPDFLIYGKHINTLVEVKPAVWSSGKLPEALFAKAIRHDVQDGPSILLLGVGPQLHGSWGHAMLGLCNQPGEGIGFELAAAQKSDDGSKFGFCSAIQGYGDRISGYYPGGSWDANSSDVMDAWHQAGNMVQWSAR